MKKVLSLLFLYFVMVSASAQTIEVMGLQSGAWDADTIKVMDDVKVADSLAVAPGTVVSFQGFHSISVLSGASFMAIGTEADSIRFTVSDTTGFSAYNLGKGGWNGFQLVEAGTVQFDYCVLEYGKAASDTDQRGGALNIINSDDVEINHSVLRCNFAREDGGAINAEGSHVTMTDCHVLENRVYTEDNLFYMYGGGLRFLCCEVEMRGMEFRSNEGLSCVGGALSLDSCAVILDRAVFMDNKGINGAGLYMMRSNHLPGRLSNLVFDSNYSGHFGGGLAFSDASPEIYNMLVTNNDSDGVNCTGVFFYQYCSPKLTNCIIYGNYPQPEANLQVDTVQMWLWTFNGEAPEFHNCLIEGGKRFIEGSEYIKVFENIIDTDPCFVDAEHHDFHLREDSPCRDAGSETFPTDLAEGLDVGGGRRVSNQRVDIGPYEYSAAEIVKQGTHDFAQLLGNPLGHKSRMVVDLDSASNVTIRVCSMSGCPMFTKVFHGEAGRNVVEIGEWVGDLVPGVYLFELKANNKTTVLKAVR